MFIFHIGPNESLDEALLTCILESQHRLNPWKQLELAQNWNRPDVAQKILTDPSFSAFTATAYSFKLMEHLTVSLLEDKSGFTKLFIDFGVPVKEYLTVSRLCELYRESVRLCYSFM